MLVLVVGDELLICDKLIHSVRTLYPDAVIYHSVWSSKLNRYISECAKREDLFDYVFLDCLRAGNYRAEAVYGIRKMMPDAVMILYPFYAGVLLSEADRKVHGVVNSPISDETVLRGMRPVTTDNLTDKHDGGHKIRVHTFGNFDVSVDGKPLVFERKKAKELFAYLVDRGGAGATTAEIAAVLWEDRAYDKGIRSQTTRTISVMRKALVRNGIGDILVKSWNSLAVDPDKLICDAYAYTKGEEWAIKSYHGEYMKNYSWAEFSNGKMQNNAE